MLKFSKIFENYFWAFMTSNTATMLKPMLGSQIARPALISSSVANVMAKREIRM